jgi:bisphosphoglycerate-independent phosphoglycerate mutase (AlkP superfamily)
MDTGPVVVVFLESSVDPGVFRSAGTGAPPRLGAAEVERALGEDRLGMAPEFARVIRTAAYRRGTTTDFMTLKERHTCTVHVFGLISDASPHGRTQHLATISDHLAYNDLPFVIHAILDGVDMPPKSAYAQLDALMDRIKGKGTIATISGRAVAWDEHESWERMLDVYRAVVHADADRYVSIEDALAVSYDAGYSDETFRPLVLGEYLGVRGELMMEVPSESDGWKWRSADLAVFAGLRGEAQQQLVSILTRTGLPDAVADKVTLRNRPVIAFDHENAAALVRIPRAPYVSSIFSEPEIEWSLGSLFASRGQKQLRIATPGRRDHVEHYFDGPARSEGVEAVHLATDAEALARAGREVTEGDASLIVVGICGRARGEVDLDSAFDALGEAVKAKGGVLLTVSEKEVRCLAASQDRGQRDDATPADIAPTILDHLGIAAPEALSGRSLFVRPRGS